jgi:hypothetical protein
MIQTIRTALAMPFRIVGITFMLLSWFIEGSL